MHIEFVPFPELLGEAFLISRFRGSFPCFRRGECARRGDSFFDGLLCEMPHQRHDGVVPHFVDWGSCTRCRAFFPVRSTINAGWDRSRRPSTSTLATIPSCSDRLDHARAVGFADGQHAVHLIAELDERCCD